MDNDFLSSEQENQSVTQENQSVEQEGQSQSAEQEEQSQSVTQQEPEPQNGSFSQSYQQQQGYSRDYYQQPQYRTQPQQPPYQPDSELEEPVSFANWMLTKLVMLIPVVNIIMLFVWAFGKTKRSKSNYFKATLAWGIIWIVVAALIVIGIFVCMMTQGY